MESKGNNSCSLHLTMLLAKKMYFKILRVKGFREIQNTFPIHIERADNVKIRYPNGVAMKLNNSSFFIMCKYLKLDKKLAGACPR